MIPVTRHGRLELTVGTLLLVGVGALLGHFDWPLALLAVPLLVWLAGIPERIGYNRDARGWLLTQAIPVPEPGDIPRHERFYYLELLRRAAMIERFPEIDAIRLDGIDEARATGTAHLSQLGIAGPVVGGVAIIASIIGTFAVRTKTDNVERALLQGLIVSGVLAAAAFAPITYWLMRDLTFRVVGNVVNTPSWGHIYLCSLIGIGVTALLFVITDY